MKFMLVDYKDKKDGVIIYCGESLIDICIIRSKFKGGGAFKFLREQDAEFQRLYKRDYS